MANEARETAWAAGRCTPRPLPRLGGGFGAALLAGARGLWHNLTAINAHGLRCFVLEPPSLIERLADDPALYFDAHVFVCTNRRADGHPKGSCAARGSEALLDYLKRTAKALGLPKIRVNSSGCLDRCESGPVLVSYPDGVWYRVRNVEEADLFLRMHLVEHGRAKELMLP